MPYPYTIRADKVDKLISMNLLEREIIGDLETGKLIAKIKINGEVIEYKYHIAKFNKQFYVREERT